MVLVWTLCYESLDLELELFFFFFFFFIVAVIRILVAVVQNGSPIIVVV
jgi:hypothetical protein